MSYAYDQLRLAIQYLAQSAPLHERLANALTESLSLRAKDLPLVCRAEFCKLLAKVALGPTTNLRKALIVKTQAITDQEAHAIAQTILFLYDTVTRYQPLLKAAIPGQWCVLEQGEQDGKGYRDAPFVSAASATS